MTDPYGDSISDDDFLRELAALGHETVDSSQQTQRNIESARETAQQDAEMLARRRENNDSEVKAKRFLRKKTSKTMDGVREKVRKARTKDRMRTVSHFLCDCCDKTILNPEDGFIVQGNVYVADPSCRGGLIGNAFPDPAEDGTILAEEVQETVFCTMCMLSALGLDKSKDYSLNSGNQQRRRA